MSTFPAFFFFFSMIKCRQGGAARLKFVMVFRLDVEWVTEGGLEKREEKVTGCGVSHA